MNRRGIFFTLLFALILGCLFQYIRIDGFLSFGSFRNFIHQQQAATEPWTDADSIARDFYIIYYDPTNVRSMYARHNAEQMLDRQKKAYASRRIDDAASDIPQYTRGVLIAAENPAQIRSMPAILTYANDGGTVLFLQRIASGRPDASNPAVLDAMGIRELGTTNWVQGLDIRTTFILGGKGMTVSEAYDTSADSVTLTPDTTIAVASSDGIPLLWTHPYGSGQVIVYNGEERDDKTQRGILAAMLSHAGSDAVYPVVGVKLFYLDDFPSPTPSGRQEKIYGETGLTTSDFYRQEWWPFVRNLGGEYGLHFTGGIIETYDNQVTGLFTAEHQEARNNLIVYGRELLNMGGELALHGYNHQPLTKNPKGLADLNYQPWPNEETMQASVTELYRYGSSLYPDYTFRVYVPPSNIIDENGIQAVHTAVPSIRVISSVYQALPSAPQFIQDFARHDDGYYDLPRISAGCMPPAEDRWAEIAAINDIGVFSHFIHPDEIVFEENRNLTWDDMKAGVTSFLADMTERFPWLTAATVSESLPYFDDYFDVDYRVLRTPDYLEIHAWGHRQEARFLLRSSRVLDHIEGCTADVAGDDVYLIRMTGDQARLYWKDDAS